MRRQSPRSPIDALARIYGFAKPYAFSRAAAFLLGGAGFAVMALIAWGALSEREPLPWDKMTQFYAYLVGVYALAAVLAFRPRLSLALFTLATFEVGLSLGLHALSQATGIRMTNMLPHMESYHRFDYHPLLQGVPKPNYEQASPYLKHDAKGRREVVGADRFKGLNVPAVNVYGGSTTYDVKVPNGQTWVDHLQKAFGLTARFYNYGVQGYSTVEHIIQTSFYARHGDAYPACAVYYVGWNDIRNLHIPDLDPGYANFHLLGQVGNLSLRNNRPSFSPLFNILVSLILYHHERMKPPPDYLPDGVDTAGTDDELERIYADNLETLITLNQAQGTKAFFVGQILNRFRLRGMGVYGWLPKVRDKDVWAVQAHYNDLTKRIAQQHGGVYIDVPIDAFDPGDFADEGHFSAVGAEKFGSYVAPALKGCARP